jgi:serine phosphatase RsbU (regulator of sigma subunit)
MNSRENRWVAIAVAFILFGGVDLVALFATPVPQRGWVMFPPIVAAVATLFVLPFVLGWLERLQDRIRQQDREIETLHALDTAIVAEGELDRVLDTAARRVMRAADAEAGGVVLYGPDSGEGASPTAETFVLADREGEDAERFAALVRQGMRHDQHWEMMIAPVQAADGEQGYLAAARYRPGAPFTDEDRSLITALAGTVGVAVTNARRLESARQAAQVRAVAEQVRADAEQVFADLLRERRVAQALTEGLLPDVPARLGSWGFSKRYVAQSDEAQVGGDIYDLFPLGPDRIGVVIADVSGKGLAAARKTAMVKYSLRSYAREHTSPARVLERLNDALTDEPELTGFVTLLYGVLDEETGRFTYASAGHEPPVIRRADGTFEFLAPTGMVLGAMRDMPYEDGATVFAPGDGMLLYTDGLTEARSGRDRDEFLTLEGVQRMLSGLRDCPPERLADALLEQVITFTSNRQSDDTALFWVERLPNGDDTEPLV